MKQRFYNPHPDQYAITDTIPHGTRVMCFIAPFSGQLGTVIRFSDEECRIKCRWFVRLDALPQSKFYGAANNLRRINKERKQDNENM